MRLGNREIVLIVAAVALAPLGLVALGNYPVLTLCMAWMLGTAFFLHHWLAPRPAQYVVASRAEMSRRTEDVIDAEIVPERNWLLDNWLVRKWLWLWRHPNHSMVMLGCVGWILCPLDGDPILIAGWCDDLAAMVLFVKHARDIYLIKWGKTPERMLLDKATELARDTASIPAALSPQRLPARSPR